MVDDRPGASAGRRAGRPAGGKAHGMLAPSLRGREGATSAPHICPLLPKRGAGGRGLGGMRPAGPDALSRFRRGAG